MLLSGGHGGQSCVFFFFFSSRRRHSRCSRDWSSDLCSSDLAFGLSGLLVKSAQQMVVTAQDLRAAGIDLPLFVGGAALTRKFTATRIAPEYGGVTLYAKDAMDGLDLANQLFSAVTRDGLVERVRAEQAALAASPPSGGEASRLAPAPERPRARLERVPVPTPPDLEPHVLRDVPLPHIYPYLNLQMLYGKHLRSEEHTSELQSRLHLVCRLLLEKKKKKYMKYMKIHSSRNEETE